MRSTFSPYGVAVDGTTTGADGQPDATIITTTARGRDPKAGYGGHMVIYSASQGGRPMLTACGSSRTARPSSRECAGWW